MRIPGFLRIRTLIIKLFGLSFALASNLVIGKQGPIIHIGAIIGAGLGLGAGRTLSVRLGGYSGGRSLLRWWRRFRTEAWKRDFVAVGAALGAAVAFGSPIGAWIWIYEEACTFWDWELAVISFGGCLSAVFVISLLNTLANSHSFLFGDFSGIKVGNSLDNLKRLSLTQFGKATQRADDLFIDYPLKDVPGYILVGVLGGVIGAVLPWISKRLTLWRYAKVVSKRKRFFEVLLFVVVTAVLKFGISWAGRSCEQFPKDFNASLAPRQELDFAPYFCKMTGADDENSFSPWATLFFNPMDGAVRAVLYVTKIDAFSAPVLFAAFVFYGVMMILSYGLAVPSGIFFPGFVVGAIMGRLVGVLVSLIFPGRDDIVVEGYAFLGSVATIGGITRDISVAVIALEATGGFQASYAAALVVLIGKLVGDRLFSKGIYDLLINLKGIPYLDEKIPHRRKYDSVLVGDISSNNLVGLRRRTKVKEVLELLTKYRHHAFPVFEKVKGAYCDQNTSGVIRPSDRMGVDLGQSIPLTSSEDGGQNTARNGEQALTSGDGEGRSSVLPVSAQTVETSAGQLVEETEQAMQDKDNSSSRRESGVAKAHDKAVGTVGTIKNDLQQNKSVRFTTANSSGKSGGLHNSQNGSSERTPNLSLDGIIERHTLLCLLRAAADTEGDEVASNDDEEDVAPQSLVNVDADGELKIIPRDKLDPAWPNSEHLKNEPRVLERVRGAGADKVIINLEHYLDPNPLIINDRAVSSEAYSLIRSSGGRHILAVNLGRGLMSGMVTRKDILPDVVVRKYEERKNL